MGIKKITYLLSLLCCLVSFGLQAQTQIEVSTSNVHRIDGTRYYLHTVQQGHTLYSISKAYAIDIEDIVEENPGVEKGIQVNQIIRIPVRKVNKRELRKTDVDLEGQFIIHKVEPKQTLFSISQKYEVGISRIEELNPELKDGLKAGMELKIPSTKKNGDTTKVEMQPAAPDSFISHEVKPKETLFSLAKKYGVNIDTLLLVNQGLPNGLRIGQTIRIPKLTEEYRKNKKGKVVKPRPLLPDTSPGRVSVVKDTNMVKEKYRIALMLPFYLDMNDTLDINHKEFEKEQVYPRSGVALDIYKGVLMALDSLPALEKQYVIKVYDTQNSHQKVRSVLQDSSFAETDLIIGPLYKSSFEIVTEYCNQHGIYQVSPVPLSNKILLGNPYVSKVVPSMAVHVKAMANYVLEHKDSAEVYVINSMKTPDQPLVNLAKRAVREYRIEHYDSLRNDSIKTLNFVSVDTNKLNLYFGDSGYYKLLVPSTDQVFVTELLTKLYEYIDKSDVSVYGIEPWAGYENIDLDYMHGLKVHVTASHNDKLSEEPTLAFYKRYRQKYHIDPNSFAVTGFRVMSFYLKALDLYGLHFPKEYGELTKAYPQYGLDFFRTGMESGFENKHVHILRFQNYQMVEVWE